MINHDIIADLEKYFQKEFNPLYCFLQKKTLPSHVRYCPLIPTEKISLTVTHLTLAYSNKQIGNIIPLSVTHLTFGFFYNKPLGNSIPTSVTHLKFGATFDQPLDNDSIPYSVTHLRFLQYYSHPMHDYIPETVTHLTLNKKNISLIGSFPQSIKVTFI